MFILAVTENTGMERVCLHQGKRLVAEWIQIQSRKEGYELFYITVVLLDLSNNIEESFLTLLMPL